MYLISSKSMLIYRMVNRIITVIMYMYNIYISLM